MSQNQFWNLHAKRLSGEISPEELTKLEQLTKENPELVYSAEQIEGIWNLTLKEPASYDSELAFELHLETLKKNGIAFPDLESPASFSEFTEQYKKPAAIKKTLIFSLTALCVLLSGGFLLWNASKKPVVAVTEKNFSEVITKPGSKSKLVLPDGTVVWLNAGSKLIYNEHFGLTNRNTTLTGEAYFDVKKSSIPFIIHANEIQIKVLGTAFNVRSYPDEKTTETSLIRGRVEITMEKRPGEKFILKPNEKLIVANEEQKTKALFREAREPIVVLKGLTHTSDSAIIETSWINNKLVFEDESFEEVAKKMERWYDVHISFKDQKVAGYYLHGIFTTETITEALDALKMGSKFNYKMEGNYITITK